MPSASTVQGRAGHPGAQEGAARPGQPDEPDDDEDGHDREGQEAEPPVEHQEDDRDPDQENEVADGEDGRLEELLQGMDIALQPGHQPTDLGLVHEGQGDALQMGEHGPAQIDEQPLGDARHQRLLDEIGDEIERDDGEEGGDADEQQALGRHGGVGGLAGEGGIDHGAQDERDGDLAQREGEDGGQRQQEPSAVGADELPEAPEDPAVEGGEDLLLVVDLRADHGMRRPRRLRRCRRSPGDVRHPHRSGSATGDGAAGAPATGSLPRLWSA